MNYRKLGRTGYDVSEIGYGGWGIGGAMWGGADDQESLRALHRAIELGVNFIDTALSYGDGHSEQLVGAVVRERPERIYAATKIPPKNGLWPARPGIPIEEAFPYRYILECAEKSLAHLGMERIDLLQFHVWNPEWDANEEWKRAVEDLKRDGKVAHFGVSVNDYQPESVLETIESGLIDTVQVIYNIFDQRAREKLFPACRRLDIGVIARVPLDEGGLTGKIDESAQFPDGDFRRYYWTAERRRELVRRLRDIEEAAGPGRLPLPELALRFCLAPAEVSAVIPGMRKLHNVEANCAVSGKAPLDDALLKRLEDRQWIRDFYPGR